MLNCLLFPLMLLHVGLPLTQVYKLESDLNLDICILVTSWLADKYNNRSMVAGVSALVGAIGYMTSALLPASSFNVCLKCMLNISRLFQDVSLTQVLRLDSDVSLSQPAVPSHVSLH